MVNFPGISNRYFWRKPVLVSVDREYEVTGNVFTYADPSFQIFLVHCFPCIGIVFIT